MQDMANETTGIPELKLIKGADGRNLPELLGVDMWRKQEIQNKVEDLAIDSYNPAQEMLDEGANYSIAGVLADMSTFCNTQSEFAFACFYTGSLTSRATK